MKRFLRASCGLVFLLSGLLKLADPARFLIDIQSMQLVPYPTAWAATFFVPWLEVIAGLALVLGRLERGASFLLAALTAFFCAIIVVTEMRGIDTACGCFGDWLVFPSVAAHLAFNAALLAALVLARPRTPA